MALTIDPPIDHIDQTSPIPLHYQLRQLLRGQIESGVYKPGDRFPTSRELRQKYGLSANTVEHALAWLVQKGLLYRTPGRGTVVSAPPVTEELAGLTGMLEVAQARGLAFKNQVLRAEFVQPTERQAQILALSPGEMAFRLDRLTKFRGDEPISMETGIYRPELGELFATEPAHMEGIIFWAIEGVMRWQLDKASQTIGATTANRRQAELLGVPVGASLLRLDRVAYLTDGRPIQFVRCWFPAARFDFHVWLYRRDGAATTLSFGHSRVSPTTDEMWEE